MPAELSSVKNSRRGMLPRGGPRANQRIVKESELETA